MDIIPFNALFIKGLSCHIDIGSIQLRNTLHAVVASDQEITRTMKHPKPVMNLSHVKSSTKLVNIIQSLTHFVYG